MFYLNRETVLTTDLLKKMIQRFNTTEKPKMQKYKNYYDGKQQILNKSYSDATKPCSRTVINYCKNIADSYCGYLATPSYISYSSENDIEDIMDILRYNDYQTQDSDLLLDALVYGRACELMYMDSEAKTRFRLINPLSCFGVHDDSLTGDLMYFVRMYKMSDWEESDEYYVDVYSDFVIQHYTMSGENGSLTFIGEEKHFFSQCPANIFYMPDEKSIFDCILTLQDSANEIVSSEIDDFSAFCDAYLAIFGADIDTEEVKKMKQNRILVLPDGTNIAWVTKNANDTQVENILKRLHDSIYRISSCVDFSNESFTGGVTSGVAIRFKLSGMETRAGKVAAIMQKVLQRRVEILCGIATLKLGEEVFRDIHIDFKRNVPEDYASLIALVNSLKGSVSDATLLGLLPFVDDVNAELEALKVQKEENMALYSFGSSTTEDDDGEEDDVA
jgi:SPP1 family phage portal protein